MRSKLKLIVSLMCIIGLLFILTACGGQSNSEQNETDQPEKISLRFSGQHPIDHMGTAAMEKIKEKIETETDGRIEITLYPAQQLGDYTQVYEDVMRGSIDMALLSVPSQYDHKLEIAWLPYIGSTYEEIKKVYSPGSYISDVVSDLHANLGVKFLGFFGEGYGGLACNKPVEEPADLTVPKSLLVRVPPMESWRLGIEALGFRTTTIPYAEVYTALQTGVADGWFGGPPNLNYAGFKDVIKYFYNYNNSYESTTFVMNMNLWESLSPEDQKIISDAITEQSLKSFDQAQEEDSYYMDLLEEYGVEIHKFTDEELLGFANHVRSNVWPELAKQLDVEEWVEGLIATY